MGFRDRLRAARGQGRASGLEVADPRFDDWEVVREFEDVETARSWKQQLVEAGIEAVISSDHPPDRFGRGDIYLQVPPDLWSEAEEFLANLDLEG
ncbi:MAG: hypothetical protein WBC01_11230 [Solirubrobacterales bacterium]